VFYVYLSLCICMLSSHLRVISIDICIVYMYCDLCIVVSEVV